MAIVGLPDKAVSEARERVRSALIASGLALPARRITVNLAPADLPKEGSHYDLPIALGLMAAIGAIPPDALSGFTVLGELGLDGSIAAVAGVLPAAIGANAREEGLICPASCGAEAAWASPELQIVAANSLIQIANHFKGTQVLSRPSNDVEPITRRIRCKEVGDGCFVSLGSGEEFNRPFGDALFSDMDISPRLGFVDELPLQDKGNWLICAFCSCGELGGLFIAGKGIVVVAAIGLIRRAALRMAPYAIFEDFVPNVAAAGLGSRRIGADEVWIKYGGM
jgi:magnesium chelatase family protein